MFCDRCGHALPSHGFICPNCGAMMNKNQIQKQQENRREENNNKRIINLLSDKYNVKKDIDYKPRKENKIIGILIILVVVIVLIVWGILKVME